jgi:diacylglycerol kinase family enzyme
VTTSIEALGNPNQIQFELTIDGQTIQTEGIACIVTNHNELGALGLNFGPKVDPGDGLLDVFVVGTVGEALSAVASGLIRLQEDATTGLQQWQGREIHITADPPQQFGLDGDPAGETPVSIRILPGAIRVLVPNAG